MSNLICLPIEALGVNGLALARGEHAIGFRAIPLLPDYGRFDGKILIGHLKRLGPYDPEGLYNRVSFTVPVSTAALRRCLRTELYRENAIPVPDYPAGEAAELVLEWCFDGLTGGVRLSTDRELELMLLFNGCVQEATVRSLTPTGVELAQQEFSVHFRWSLPAASVATAGELEALESELRGFLPAAPAAAGTLAGVRLRLKPETPLYLTLSETGAEPLPEVLDARLEAGLRQLEAGLMTSSGSADGCADALERLIGYSAAYDPRNQLRYLPVNRDWAGPNSLPAIFMWDNFFDSYLGCFSHPELARESLSHILNVIAERGITGAPPQRNLVIPIVYSKLVRFIGDEEFARRSFPAMMAFMRFWFADRGDGHPWRDGNDDGLIESGTCLRPDSGVTLGRLVSDAMDETGYDDSPMYSAGFAYERRALPADGIRFDFERGTLNLTLVGQNSLYVAGCRALAVLADELDADEDARWLRSEAERVAGRIRERLYDPASGIYLNRFFDGTFSPVKTPDIFSPLTAELPDPETRERLHRILLDPKQFWGENVIPTVSYDDPAFGDEPFRSPYWRGNYWRGNVWAPTNYITYLALRKADWPETTAEFCARSRRLFLDDWIDFHHANENYPPFGRTDSTHMFSGNGGRDPHYIWAGLLPVLALEELFSVEDTAPGLRFGAVEEKSFGSWRNFRYHGKAGSIEAGPEGVRLRIGDDFELSTDAPVKFYEFRKRDGRWSFRYRAPRGARLTLRSGTQTLNQTLPVAATPQTMEVSA